MAFSNAFSKPFILEREGEGELSVPLLTMDQISEVLTLIETRRHSRLLKNAAEQKLSPFDTAKFVEIGEREELELQHLDIHASSIKGTADILPKVLPAEVIATLSVEERVAASRGAVGWKAPKKPVAEGKNTENPSSSPAPSNGSATGG